MTILVNALSNTPFLGGKNVGEISDSYPTLFTPAGYVFSIWGIIYTLLLIFTVYQALPKQRNKPFLTKTSFLYVLGCLANIVWIILWVRESIIPSTLLMFILLVSLIAIYLRLGIGKSKVGLREKLAVHLPFSVYLGWITVASIANVAISLTVANWDAFGLSEVFWTTFMMGIATLVTLIVILTRGDIGYSMVIIWALAGIAVKQIETQSIVLTAGVGATLILLTLAVKLFKK